MKVRTDFVSNSSSSSFILQDVGFFNHFGISKQDMHDAIVELMGGAECFDKRLKEEIASHESGLAKAEADLAASEDKDSWEVSWHRERLEKLKTDGLDVFCIYDMTNEDDRMKCFREWDSHFAEWYAPNEGKYQEWNSLLDLLRYECKFDNVDSVASGEQSELKTCSKKDGKAVYEVFPGGAAFVKHVKRCLKVKTMKDVLHDKACTLMIHFDDNEIYGIEGMTEDDKSKWESPSYSSARFWEILIKHFVEKGKINLNDPELVNCWKVNDNDDWFKKHHPGQMTYLDNDKVTCKDIEEDLLNCNARLHEG